jgi:hypothetical protein
VRFAFSKLLIKREFCKNALQTFENIGNTCNSCENKGVRRYNSYLRPVFDTPNPPCRGSLILKGLRRQWLQIFGFIGVKCQSTAKWRIQDVGLSKNEGALKRSALLLLLG